MNEEFLKWNQVIKILIYRPAGNSSAFNLLFFASANRKIFEKAALLDQANFFHYPNFMSSICPIDFCPATDLINIEGIGRVKQKKAHDFYFRCRSEKFL